MYEELSKLKNKKMNNPIKKRKGKEEKWMTNNPIKKMLSVGPQGNANETTMQHHHTSPKKG